MKNQTTLSRPSDREIVVTRLFNAPPRIVFEAYTRPELVRRWWAPRSRGVTMVDVQADLKPGGKWRYVFNHASHGDMAFSGTYREVTPHARLVYTEIFEPASQGPDDEGSLVTVTFEARGKQTLLTSSSLFPSREVLDAVLETGMEGGMRESLDQLDELAASLAEGGRERA